MAQPLAQDLPPPTRHVFGPITVILGHKSGKYPDANMMVVTGRDSRAAVDAPLCSNRVGADFDGCDLVILSHVHEDHMAGLHRLPQAAVAVHRLDWPAAASWEGYRDALGLSEAVWPAMRKKLAAEFAFTPRADAAPYEDGHVFDLGGVRLTAMLLPGHTAGHCALIEETQGLAFIADIDLSGFGPYYGDATSSLQDFRSSLERLESLDARTIVTGHHRGIYTDRARFLADLKAYRDKLDARDDKLLAMLADGPRSMASLVAERLIYPPDYEELWVEDVERRTIEQHLAALAAEGRVVAENGLWSRA
ncbi:MBL fold metallo-hydrolase [Phreatobacter sp.]|uniref:MBL fold metallo-hydrolase n=1 Tax=Phreatobacter sp. TaxID=1966341 RepID=UPI0022C5C01A|nr:MBL fold metallo-hydrolase [Phreatobacter sp.]MCZ8314257.1 MBL fold metallo-hydrolase [Phreatobacter sp.]